RPGREAHAEEDPERLEAVAPGDLLPFRIRAAVVGDRKLVDPQPALADLARQLRLDRESVLPEVERAEDVAAERLVARLHVGERRVEQHAGNEAEEAVADAVPE